MKYICWNYDLKKDYILNIRVIVTWPLPFFTLPFTPCPVATSRPLGCRAMLKQNHCIVINLMYKATGLLKFGWFITIWLLVCVPCSVSVNAVPCCTAPQWSPWSRWSRQYLGQTCCFGHHFHGTHTWKWHRPVAEVLLYILYTEGRYYRNWLLHPV